MNLRFIDGASTPVGVALDADHIYWTNYATGTIGRANLDGSRVSQRFISGAKSPWGVAVDARHLYWSNYYAGTVSRANLDGKAVSRSFFVTSGPVGGVAVDGPRAPQTTISSASISRRGPEARFRFSSSQPGSSFNCSLDGKAFKSCASPKTYGRLQKGGHTFRVKARNATAADRSPAKRQFRI